ncbi:hypothetical protein BOTBODRAFT_147356 [Botryobasidium botryosum FD-172 SS1]|uniref:Zinc-finger domain-containing protein n=1 Tax=Botryobasidium botryosum (strain FD-172 SS1) TaxID=930990 RepID=A0A067M684_BOTB1|nr:hypothetical protein BOTBODRAFT_147356 [Botryobasidium botryosum FD-172 SS1]
MGSPRPPPSSDDDIQIIGDGDRKIAMEEYVLNRLGMDELQQLEPASSSKPQQPREEQELDSDGTTSHPIPGKRYTFAYVLVPPPPRSLIRKNSNRLLPTSSTSAPNQRPAPPASSHRGGEQRHGKAATIWWTKRRRVDYQEQTSRGIATHYSELADYHASAPPRKRKPSARYSESNLASHHVDDDTFSSDDSPSPPLPSSSSDSSFAPNSPLTTTSHAKPSSQKTTKNLTGNRKPPPRGRPRDGATRPTTCHQCRNSKNRNPVVYCSAVRFTGESCTACFCIACLKKHYGMDNPGSTALFCPRCQGKCICSFCRVKKSQKPLGELPQSGSREEHHGRDPIIPPIASSNPKAPSLKLFVRAPPKPKPRTSSSTLPATQYNPPYPPTFSSSDLDSSSAPTTLHTTPFDFDASLMVDREGSPATSTGDPLNFPDEYTRPVLVSSPRPMHQGPTLVPDSPWTKKKMSLKAPPSPSPLSYHPTTHLSLSPDDMEMAGVADEDGIYEIEVPESSMEAAPRPALDPIHHSEPGTSVRADDMHGPTESGYLLGAQGDHTMEDQPSYTFDALGEMDYNLSHLPPASSLDNAYALPDFGLNNLSGLSGGCGHMYDWGSGIYETAHDNGYGGGHGYGYGSGNGHGWSAAG